MDSIFDSPYWPVFCVLSGSFLIFAAFFYLLWRCFFGPKQITSAIKARMAPSAIRNYLGKANWAGAGVLSLLLGGVLTFISWRYFGAWLFNTAVDSLKNRVATWFLKSVGILPLDVGGLDHTPFIPIVCVVALIIGVFAGAILGKRIGVRRAAREYHLTKNLFPKKRS